MVSRPLVSIAERVRKEWLALVSRKITARYSGWMPGFMGCLRLEDAVREGADYTYKSVLKAPGALQLQVPVDERDGQPLGLHVQGDHPGGVQAAEAALPAGQVVGGRGMGHGAVEAVDPRRQGAGQDRLAQRRQ